MYLTTLVWNLSIESILILSNLSIFSKKFSSNKINIIKSDDTCIITLNNNMTIYRKGYKYPFLYIYLLYIKKEIFFLLEKSPSLYISFTLSLDFVYLFYSIFIKNNMMVPTIILFFTLYFIILSTL